MTTSAFENMHVDITSAKPFAQAVKEILGEAVTAQIAKRSELQKFAVIPKRWVVERSFAWLDKNRQL